MKIKETKVSVVQKVEYTLLYIGDVDRGHSIQGTQPYLTELSYKDVSKCQS